MTVSRRSNDQQRIGSSSQRVGCDFCFRTLDPNRGDDLNRAFTSCRDCGRNYHQSHAESRCPICGREQIVPVNVATPPPLRIEQRRANKLEPLQPLSQTEQNGVGVGLAAYIAPIRHGLRLALLGLLALLFILIATAIGVYTYRWEEIFRLYSGSPELPERLVDTVLREPTPRLVVFAMALLASSVTAYALFPVILRDKRGQRSMMRRLWRIIGSIVLLLSANVLLFNIRILDGMPIAIIGNDLLNRSVTREIILGQLGAIVVTTVLSIPYLIITRNPPSPPDYPLLFNLFRLTGSLVRYLIVFYTVMCLVVSVGVTQLNDAEGLIFNFIPAIPNKPTDAEVRVMMIALTALAVGLLIYHIPHYRIKLEPGRPLNIAIRLLGTLACLGLAAYLYNQVEADSLLEAAALGSGLALAFLPTQRAYT